MSAIEHLLPWDAQPQEAVEPDRAALARFGIVGGILVRGDWQPNPRDIVSGAGLTYSVGSGDFVGLRPVARAPGVVVEYFDDTSNRTVSHATGSPSIQSMTYLARVRVNVAPKSPGVVCRGGTPNIPLWRNGTSFDMRVNGTDYTGAGTWTLGQWYDIEIVSSASACVMTVDGQAVISGAAAAAGTMNSTLAWGDVDGGGGVSSGDVEFQYSLFSNRPLTPSELAEFRANPWQLFEARRIPVPVSAGGGGSWSVSLTETASANDSLGAATTPLVSLIESASAADIITAATIAAVALTEAASASDTQTASYSVTGSGSVTESASASDTLDAATTMLRALTETASADDQLAAATTMLRAISESASAVDTPAASYSGAGTATIEELTSATDALTAAATLLVTILEAGSATDALAAATTMVRAITEQATAIDTVAGALPGSTWDVSIEELAAAVDLIAGYAAGGLTVSPLGLRLSTTARMPRLSTRTR